MLTLSIPLVIHSKPHIMGNARKCPCVICMDQLLTKRPLGQVRLAKLHITKTCLYNFGPLKPHFYIVKLGFTGVYIIILTSAQEHRCGYLVRTASLRQF